MSKFKRILMATDFSDCSKVALDHAIQIAKAFNAEIHLLYVFEMQYTEIYPELAKGMEEVMKEETKALNELSEKIRAQNIEVYAMSKYGSPGHQIVETAKRIQADLIVVGSHGRTGLAHMLIGSVAERVVRIAPCPVTVVPQKSQTDMDEEQGTVPLSLP